MPLSKLKSTYNRPPAGTDQPAHWAYSTAIHTRRPRLNPDGCRPLMIRTCRILPIRTAEGRRIRQAFCRTQEVPNCRGRLFADRTADHGPSGQDPGLLARVQNGLDVAQFAYRCRGLGVETGRSQQRSTAQGPGHNFADLR